MEKIHLNQRPVAPELLEQLPHPGGYQDQTDFSTLPSVQNFGPFFENIYTYVNETPRNTSNDSITREALPFGFSLTKNPPKLYPAKNKPERLSSSSQPNKRRKIAQCGSPIPSEPSECCSSCSDGMPCVDPDCEEEKEPPPCADPNCSLALEEVVLCSGNGECSIPVCNSQCIELPNAQVSLLGAGNWTESEPYDSSHLDGTNRRDNQFSSGILQCLEVFQSSESSLPTTPSMANNPPVPYASHIELHALQNGHSARSRYVDQPANLPCNSTEFPRSMMSSRNPQSSTGDIFTQPWNSNGDKSTMFYCPWQGCNQPLETDDWMTHLHQEHVDPQMTFHCPFQEETCPPEMDTNPLAHLESDHGYIFDSNGNGYSCPSPTCPQDLTFCNPSTLHNHLDYAHATPNSRTLQCRLNSCDNLFKDSNQLVSHVNQHHPLPALVSRDGNTNLSEARPDRNSLQDTYEPHCSSQEDSQPTVDSEGSVLKKDVGSDPVHSCRWKLSDGTICQKPCISETELQAHIKDTHLEPLDHKTGYYCFWEGCMRHSKLGTKSGFSQRGKLERHMATHTNFKCSKCDICGKDFSAPQAMKQHRRLHTGERPWKCKHCDKRFAQQSACTVHERTHTNEKPLECPICHKKFSESSNLAKHRKTHGEKGNHACTVPGCEKSYHRLDQLKRHLLTHNKGEDGGSEEGSDSQGEEGL